MQRERLRVPGFRACGVRAGIKARGLDLALLVSDAPAAVAGVFTRSSVVGAPVELCRRRVRSGFSRGVVVNSGCSNVAMGERGRRDAAEMARRAALAVGAAPAEMLVASTGVIGKPLPMARIARGIARGCRRALRVRAGATPPRRSARPTPSRSSRTPAVVLGGRRVTLAGIAKGSGMIEPNMGTLLAFLLTDAAASPALSARRPAARGGCELQPRDGRRRDLDQRHAAAVRERGGRQHRAAQPARARRARLRGGARGGGDLARARRGAGRRGGDAAGHGRRARGAHAPPRPSGPRAGSPIRCSSRPPSSGGMRTGAASSRRSGQGGSGSRSSAPR